MRGPEYYRDLWDTMRVRPEWEPQVKAAATRLQTQRALYDGLGPDWRLVGAIHHMECDADPARQILNGQRWDRITTIHPKGIGPFTSWREAALLALREHALATLRDVERWNGRGYEFRDLNSPYVWSGSNHYEKGKYGSDGRFDPNLVSKQVGAALILAALKWKPAA